METDKLHIENSVKIVDKTESKNACEIRHILAILAFFAFVCLFAMRVNLSVAIVAMVEKSQEEMLTNENTTLESCPTGQNREYSDNISSNAVGEFTWNEKTQGFILGSFYYSYGLANVIGGRTADYFESRMLVGVATLASAILTILTPMASRLGAGFLIAIRVLEGCFQGVIFPAMNKLITRWYTTEERSKFTGIIFAGMDFGCVLTFPISGWLCESDFLGGWPSVFYVFGGLSIIWCLFWFSLIRDDPKKHPRISAEELKYILEGSPNTEQKHPVPWSSILRSKYFWATVIGQTGLNFGYFVLLSELPTYFANILHIPINNNGLLTAMPSLATWIFSMTYSFAIDKAIKSEYLTILSVRRLSVAISGYGPMLCLIGMCFVNCNIGGAFAVLILSGAFIGAAYCGTFSSHSDLSPRFAGTLMGLATAFGGIAGFAGPAITGIITEGNQSIPAWRIVFIMCAIISGITATIYELFITTEIQPWNDPKTMSEKKRNRVYCQEEKFLENSG